MRIAMPLKMPWKPIHAGIVAQTEQARLAGLRDSLERVRLSRSAACPP
jgi:hypothetical protein